MRRFLLCFVCLLSFLSLVLPVFAQTRGQGVGALAGTTDTGASVSITTGRTAPWSEVIVETAAGAVQAVAEIDGEGVFSFSFNTLPGNLGSLKIYGVDEIGVTEAIPIPGASLTDFILPPTITGNSTGLPDTSVGLKGYAYRGSAITVTLNSTSGFNETYPTTANGETGLWSLDIDGLLGGDYTAFAKAGYAGLASAKSQDLTFTLSGPTSIAQGLIGQIASASAELVNTLITTTTNTINTLITTTINAVNALPQEAKQTADTASKLLVPVTAAALLWQSGLLQMIFSYDYLTTGIRVLLGLFIPLKRKKNRWGIVYDGVTKRPLAGAIIRLFRASGELVETEATGKTGVFSFLPGEGQYEIKVSLPGYVFPSKLITGAEDGEYQTIYHGSFFALSRINPVVNLSVPIDPKGYTGFLAGSILKALFARAAWYANVGLYVVGLFFSLIAYMVNPIAYNGVVLVFYGATFAFFVYNIYANWAQWGVVVDAAGKPAPGVALSLLDSIFRRLVHRRVTDNFGRYQFVVPEGGYIMLVTSPDWELAPLAKGYDGSVLTVAKKIGIVKPNVVVRKKAPRAFRE